MLRDTSTLLASAVALALLSLPLAPVAVAEDKNPGLFGVDLDVNLPWFRAEADGAVFERPRYASEGALYVRQDDGRWRVYRGADYDTIVRENEDLRTNASLTALGQSVKTTFKADVAEPSPGWHAVAGTPDFRYRVTNWDGPARIYMTTDGREYVYMGKDFDAIVEANPDIKKNPRYDVLRDEVATLRTMKLAPKPLLDTRSYVVFNLADDGLLVRTWVFKNGKWERSDFQGADIAVIRKAHPEADRILGAWVPGPEGETASAIGAQFANSTYMVGSHAVPCVKVSAVAENSVAARIGLKAGDKITTINGKVVHTAIAAARMLAKSETLSELQVMRDGASHTLRMPKTASLSK